jgi:hypothetical protein
MAKPQVSFLLENWKERMKKVFVKKTEARNGVEKKKKRKSWFWSKKWNQF